MLETSDDPRSIVVHRPSGDGALASTLDALVYFALGLRVGFEWGADRQSVEHAFRCFNLVGRPPFRVGLFQIARESFQSLMKRPAGEGLVGQAVVHILSLIGFWNRLLVLSAVDVVFLEPGAGPWADRADALLEQRLRVKKGDEL